MIMGMNFKDIVALATAGYKVSEVKELIALANQSETPAPEGENKKDQPEKTQQHDAGKEQPEEAAQNGTETPKEDSAILSYKKEIEDLKKQIKDLQSENVHKDNSDVEEINEEEMLNNITASFM